jgi:hypothetical protein
MLRLFIRSCPRTYGSPILDQDVPHAPESLASSIVDSAVWYLSLKNGARPWQTYLTLLVIDASSRLRPILKRQARSPTPAAYRAIDSIANAQEFLRNSGCSNLSITLKAAKRLEEIVVEVNMAFAMARPIPRPLQVLPWAFGSPGAEQGQVGDSVTELCPADDRVFDVSETWQASEDIDLLWAEAFPLTLL